MRRATTTLWSSCRSSARCFLSPPAPSACAMSAPAEESQRVYRVAVIGAGGVGAVYAARLCAIPGVEVHCVCRGAHQEAIAHNGICVTSIGGDASARVASATASPEDVGVVDLCIVALKTWQLERGGVELSALIGPRTLVLPTQNGVDTPTRLGQLCGCEHVLGGYSRISSFLTAPGQVTHTSVHPVVQGAGLLPTSGAWCAAELQRCVAALAPCAHLKIVVEPNVLHSMWQKLATMAPFSTLCAAARCPLGPLMEAPESRALVRACIEETACVARACGVELTDSDVQASLNTLAALPPGVTPSMMRDMLAGRPSELNEQTGAVVRLGREKGVPTPVLSVLLSVLLPMERMHRGELAFPAAVE